MRALVLSFILLISLPSRAAFLCISHSSCDDEGGAKAPVPSKNSAVRVNPAAVPTEVGYGVEAIAYDGIDFLLIKGLGRAGAALSPSNTEETFFGAPASEMPDELEARKRLHKKYESAKYTLAAAFKLFDNKRSDLKKFSMSFGALAKYNRELGTLTPGAGISTILGPFSLGYSLYADQTRVGPLESSEVLRYDVETYSAGFYLSSLVLDYSVLREKIADPPVVTLSTMSLIYGRSILTGAYRFEKSNRPSYNYEKQRLEVTGEKRDIFLGYQFRITPAFMLGAFYNYYLVHDLSLSAALFF